MTQSEDGANALHDFNDVASREMRDYNRGAVLANIHEGYINESGGISNSNMYNWLSDIASYLARIPSDEHLSAKEAMRIHLRKRGLDG